MKNHLFKPLLALALVLVCGNVWGETKTVTYAQSSTSAASVTKGTAPSGSSVTFNNTYTTKDKLTKGNSMTYTLSGYAGYVIKSLTMSMHSNKSAGTGSFSFKAGETTLAEISSDTGFNQSAWNGAWAQSYTDVTPNMLNSNYTIQNGEDVVLTITASVNSLYCQSITIEYEDNNTPIGPVDPTITTINMSCGVGENIDVSQMFSSNSDGVITYSVEGANAEDYELYGSDFLSEVAGTYTIKASQAAVDGEFKAGEATATLTVLGKYTVNYYSLGTNIGTEEVVDGQSIANAPDVTNAPAGWSFYGWTDDGQYSFSTTAPVLFDGVVTSNVSLYAVYGKTEVIGKSEYRRVTADQSDWRGDYLIAYSKTVFMDGSLSGGDTGVGKAQAHVSPGKACSTDEMTITADWGDEHYVTIEAIDDADLSKGYVIKSHNTISPYFYYSSNSNGISGTDYKKTAAKYPISVIFNSASDIDIALGGEATGAILHYNNNVGSKGEMFRFYKDGGQENVYLYKKNDGTCTTYALIPDYTVAISSVGFATAYMGFDATVTGANAYYVTVRDDVASLTKVEGVIPANTGVVLEAQNGGATTATFTESVATVEDKAAAEGNMLVGSIVGKTFDAEGYTYYILSKGTGEKADAVGFYWDKNSYNGTQARCGANKAILAVPATGGAATSSISIRFDGATMIENIVEVENNIYYDLQGRKVKNPSNGLYIVNGKKMLVK